MQKNDVYKMEITGMSSDGNGVGRVDGLAVFVPRTAVGDVVLTKIVKRQKNFAFGILDGIVSPSRDRIAIDCASFPRCGGCDFRHISYEAELRCKKAFVEDAVRRIGGLSAEVRDVLGCPQPERYRNKVQFPVYEGERGVAVGFYAPRSHRTVAVGDCLLQPKSANSIAKDCCALLEKLGVPAYDETAHSGVVRYIMVRTSSVDSSSMVCLVINADQFAGERQFAKELTALQPAVKTIVLNTNKENTNVILGRKNRTVSGEGFLRDHIGSVPVRISPGSFFQVNRFSTGILYDKIAEYAAVKDGDTVLDLYCGAGTIGLSIARENCRLIGVEHVKSAVEDAEYNAAQLGFKNVAFYCEDAAAFTERFAKADGAADIAVVDPPRQGCGERLLSSVAKLSLKRLIMVSCNAATLARDLKYLSENGFAANEIQPVDMFPRTKHVETVVLMSRTEGK